MDSATGDENLQAFEVEDVTPSKPQNSVLAITHGSTLPHLEGIAVIKDAEENVADAGASEWPNRLSLTQHDVFEGHLRMMEMQGLKYELPVSTVLRATEFNPFQKKLCPFRCGKNLKTGPHMRGFWFATISFFLAFLGWFSMAPLMVLIREDIGICDNQSDVDDNGAECECTDACKNTIGNLKIASFSSTIIMRILVGGFLERWGPRKVQCTLLVCGSIFVASASLITDVAGMILVGVFIGTIGAAFIPNQFWMALMFSPEILGLVNGTAGGWGNLGGGIANMVMPQFELLTGNWRTALLIPAGILLTFGILMFFFSQDTPIGPIVIERDLKKKKTSPKDYLKCLSDYRVWIIMIQYGACFGAELTMNWELATHFHDYFGMSLINAGWLSSGFGTMNIFARSIGGDLSDRLNRKMGLRGRLLIQLILLFCEACCLLLFGFMTNDLKWGAAFTVMVFFSIFTQGAEGSTFSIVPYIQCENLGIVCALTGAGGNLFAVLIQAVFYKSISDFLLPFKLHAIFVFFGAFLTFFIIFDLQGSLLLQPKLARYCVDDLFSYVLEWELQFDSTYHVVGSYLSPVYLTTLLEERKEESYVKAAWNISFEYGEGLVGSVGETRRSCIVEIISDLMATAPHGNTFYNYNAAQDQIRTALFFPSGDGKRVIEVGGLAQYELVDGATLTKIETVLTAKGRGKDIKSCIRKVTDSPTDV